MSKAVVAGEDRDGLAAALEARDVQVTRAAGTASRPDLEEAGILEADLFVLTDADLATAIPIARDLNPDLRVVVYARESLPEFALAGAGHIVDPELLDAATVAEELV